MTVFALVGRKRSGKDTAAGVISREKKAHILHIADSLKDFCYETCDAIYGSCFISCDILKDEYIDHCRTAVVDEKAKAKIKESMQKIFFKDLDDATVESVVQLFLGNTVCPRIIFQSVGTIFRDTYGANIFVDSICGVIAEEPNLNYVIADVRYPNEMEALKRFSCISLKIIRPSLLLTDVHPSETEMENIATDKVIINDGSLQEYEDKVRNSLK